MLPLTCELSLCCTAPVELQIQALVLALGIYFGQDLVELEVSNFGVEYSDFVLKE